MLGAPGVLEWRGKLIYAPPSENYLRPFVVKIITTDKIFALFKVQSFE